MVIEIKAESWNHLQELIFEDSWSEDIGRFRSRYAFRGLSDCSYKLETTLMRMGGDFAILERHLMRNFIKYAHRNMAQGDSVWHWVSVAQHYGLPTRLLDWTYSPLIAMHFATANIDKVHIDGAIWAVNYLKLHRLIPPELKNELDSEGANVFTVKMLSERVASFRELEDLSKSAFALFFEPPSMDDRIVNQYALFSVMSNPHSTFDSWLNEHPEIWRKIIIPAELKWEVRDKLDQANITERVLFPGLDGLSKWLKRHYSPRT